VVVHTDHKNLTYWKDPRKLTSCQSRWQLQLSEYDLILQHIPGKDLVAPDALSRRVDHIPDDIADHNDNQLMFPPSFFREEEIAPLRLIQPGLQERLCITSDVDSVVQTAINTLNNSALSPMQRALSDWKYKGELLTFKGRYYVPPGDL
jgi:hypothetical protein